jgi:signal transduction histidine kinase
VTTTAADNYAAVVSQRVAAERLSLASQWLARLKELLTVDPNEVFPSSQLLDHIPLLIAEIASYLSAPADEEIAANAAVIDKARELGILRHAQRASVHQLLREYEILGDVLQLFVTEETARLKLTPSAADCFEVLHRLTRSIAALMRTTVDTFVSEYTGTIQEQNDRLRAFHRAASHELRSPVGTILFATAVLDRDRAQIVQDDGRLAKIVTTLRNNAERLRWLIENLQRIGGLSEPMDTPSLQRMDVETIAAEVARQLAEMASSRGVSIRIASGLPTIVVDSARLELVMLNLVSNAIKYCNPERRDRYVEIAPGAEADEDTVQSTIVVRDNGLGIPDAELPTVFQRFTRAHAHLDQKLGITGSGLGLAIVADCVEELGGSIRCESSVEQGTAFYVTLPLTAAPSQPRGV